MQLSRIVQLPRSSRHPDTLGVDTQGSVEVVLVVEVDVEVVDVDVLVLLVVVLEVVVMVGTAIPQCASVQDGLSPSVICSVTRHVSDGSAQCENWIALMSHSGPAWQRGALGSTHRHPANMASAW